MASSAKITCSNFVALLGYDGRNAIVDRVFARTHGKKKMLELAECGYYRAALCVAVYNDGDGSDELMAWLHSRELFADYDYERLKLLFGVPQIEEIEKVVMV